MSEIIREDEQTSRVVEFKPKKDSIVVANRYARTCAHRRVEVDERERTLTCLDCEKQVDPITFIVEWANGFRTIEHDIEAWKAMHEDLAGQQFDDRFKQDQQYIRSMPSDPVGAGIWKEFQTYFGDRDFRMTKRRKAAGGWYGHYSPNGDDHCECAVSIEYVRSRMAKNGWAAAAQKSSRKEAQK